MEDLLIALDGWLLVTFGILESWLLVVRSLVWETLEGFGRLAAGFGMLVVGRLVVVLEDWKVGSWKIGRSVMVLVVGIGRLDGFVVVLVVGIGRLERWLLEGWLLFWLMVCCFGCWYWKDGCWLLVVGCWLLVVGCWSRTRGRRGSADTLMAMALPKTCKDSNSNSNSNGNSNTVMAIATALWQWR